MDFNVDVICNGTGEIRKEGMLLAAAPWLVLAWRALCELSKLCCGRLRRASVEQPRDAQQQRQRAAPSCGDGHEGRDAEESKKTQ